MEEFKQSRIESLERLIPEMISRREKRCSQRFALSFVILFLLVFFILCKIGVATVGIRLILSLALTVLLFIVSYIVSSATFLANAHESLVIEKLKTEYYTLTNKHDEYDMTIAIGKMRDNFPFYTK